MNRGEVFVSGWTSKTHAKARWTVLGIALTLATLVVVMGGAPAAQADPTVGYRDMSYGTGGVQSPTAVKPQSKIWYTPDGTWWGILYDKASQDYHIFRLNRTTQSWVDTGTLVDGRNNSRTDALWDGTHLYVASAVTGSASSDLNAYLKRYSYDPTTGFTRDQGFDKEVKVASGGMEAIVLAKDSTGKLWVTFTQDNKVYINHSLDSDANWGVPQVLPVNGASNLTPDDISSIVSFDRGQAPPKIGVMWSNRTDDAIYFSSHNDAAPDTSWSPATKVLQGPKSADDHINLRSVQADPSGRVFAAIKTSYDELPNDPSLPLVYLAVLKQDGTFEKHVFSRVAENHTRPIVMIDSENRQLYMFATSEISPGDAIVYKKTPLDNINFQPGEGTTFIDDSDPNQTINNATSTKQTVNSRSDLVVLASTDTSRPTPPVPPIEGFYYHNVLPINPVPVTPSDTTKPTITRVSPRPKARITDRTPIISATVRDNVTNIRKANITLFVAGKRVPATKFAYRAVTDRLVYHAPRMPLGKKTVRIVARDAAGNVGSTAWYFTIVRKR